MFQGRFDGSGNIIPDAGTVADKAHYLANVHVVAFCYLLGGAKIMNFKFVDRANLQRLTNDVKEIWDSTLWLVESDEPDFSRSYDAGGQAFLASVTFPCWRGRDFQYMTSKRTITTYDVVDLMYELMDIKPRTQRYFTESGKEWVRFSWMFLASDLDRLLAEFPNAKEVYKPNWRLSFDEIYCDVGKKLTCLARRALDVYPFLECELHGW